jgi:hypothetical protein
MQSQSKLIISHKSFPQDVLTRVYRTNRVINHGGENWNSEFSVGGDSFHVALTQVEGVDSVYLEGRYTCTIRINSAFTWPEVEEKLLDVLLEQLNIDDFDIIQDDTDGMMYVRLNVGSHIVVFRTTLETFDSLEVVILAPGDEENASEVG